MPGSDLAKRPSRCSLIDSIVHGLSLVISVSGRQPCTIWADAALDLHDLAVHALRQVRREPADCRGDVGRVERRLRRFVVAHATAHEVLGERVSATGRDRVDAHAEALELACEHDRHRAMPALAAA